MFQLAFEKFKVLGGLHVTQTDYPHAFLKKRRGYCYRLRPSVRLSVRPSVMLSPPKPLDEIQPNLVCELLIEFRPVVCPLCYLLLSHWTKLNQIWCVSYSHEWGAQRKKFVLPRPLGPWGGVKRSNTI